MKQLVEISKSNINVFQSDCTLFRLLLIKYRDMHEWSKKNAASVCDKGVAQKKHLPLGGFHLN